MLSSSVWNVPFILENLPLIGTALLSQALSIVAQLQVGPAWCRGKFFLTLGLRVNSVVFPVLTLTEILCQVNGSPDDVASHAAFLLSCRHVFAVSLGDQSSHLQ